jgi:HAD superfamily hydrolase (TIGR01490 family)
VAKSALTHIQYILGNADAETTEKMRKQLSELATGWDVAQLREIAEDAVNEQINPYVYQEAVNLIGEHHELGHDVIIISASATELVAPIAKLLGADHYVATVLKIEDGKYTGEIEFYAYGLNKAEAIIEMAEKYNYDLSSSYAYTDSITDVPMLEAVGYGTVVNPDKALRQLAVEQGWNMLRFANPVTLRGSVAQKVATIPGHVANIPGHVANIPGHVSHIPGRVATIPGRVATNIPENLMDKIPEAVKENPKRTAVIAATGAAVAGIAIARSIKRNG